MGTRTRLVGAAGALTALGTLAVNTVGGYEGLRLVAYQDVIGVWTACRGETAGIKKGMRFTREQCDVMFIDSLTRHEAGMRACLKDPDGIPAEIYVAELSLTYNIGVGGFCKSSMPAKLNAKNYVAACNTFGSFVKAGGKVIKGLVTRRLQEAALCRKGLR
ncbi:lysozyme [Mesorhizobium sp. M4B.F.Ca.ET.143.01.1.1]|uniref:lysozyme n=1 Tax=Mesorhizobium sp. M4B.F.Ca.ET.143.01.1.1 TaxID=2563947 RepID=UPI001093C89A|nr:lysozyme [Mesorhizobium sp. M4B.F.Ca.ET.143.01.1.1]TGV26325.1 lysozyme [Mesorhizobium sp. M4B.F.Ca.ET.143.01.1.1]